MGIPKYATINIDSAYCGADGCDALVIMPATMMQEFRDNHNRWYCYRGHPRCFLGESEEEKLKDQLAAKEKQLQREIKRKEWAQQAEKKAEYQRRAAKGLLTKARNRIKNGVCPCCNRTFKNLARHMEGQHPAWGQEEKR